MLYDILYVLYNIILYGLYDRIFYVLYDIILYGLYDILYVSYDIILSVLYIILYNLRPEGRMPLLNSKLWENQKEVTPLLSSEI